MAVSAKQLLTSSSNSLCLESGQYAAQATLSMDRYKKGLAVRKDPDVVPGGNATMGHFGANFVTY